jgi:hypothetical protein
MNYNPDHAAISIVGDFTKVKAALTVLKWKKSVTEEENPTKSDCHPTRKQITK